MIFVSWSLLKFSFAPLFMYWICAVVHMKSSTEICIYEKIAKYLAIYDDEYEPFDQDEDSSESESDAAIEHNENLEDASSSGN